MEKCSRCPNIENLQKLPMNKIDPFNIKFCRVCSECYDFEMKYGLSTSVIMNLKEIYKEFLLSGRKPHIDDNCDCIKNNCFAVNYRY